MLNRTAVIIKDYLKSFNSIFDSSIYGEVNKEDSHIVMHILSAMANNVSVNDQNLQAIVENYLIKTIKLSAVEIGLLKNKLMENTKLGSIWRSENE